MGALKIVAFDLHPVYNVPMLGTHKAVLDNRLPEMISAATTPNPQSKARRR
jgi:hypothetical protein